MRGDKSQLEFGKRGGKTAEPAERKPSALERMKNAGGRWLGGLKKAKPARAKGFKRARQRP